MEHISEDLFTSILSYLPEKSIAALITNKNFDEAIKESAKTKIFWKQRVETLIGKYLDNVFSNWKVIYDNLIVDFEGKVDLKEFGSKALIASSKNNHTEVVKILLADLRVNPYAEDNSAIIYASMNGNSEVVKLLLDDGRANPSADNNYAIIIASRYNHPEVVTLLLEDERVDPSVKNNSAIKFASMSGHSEVVKLLLDDDRVDPSAANNFSIRWASKNLHLKVIKLLLSDKRVDPSIDNNIVIIQASESGHLELVKLLLADKRRETKVLPAYNVDPSADNNSAIIKASANGHSEVVKVLLADERVDPSADNNRAISLASKNGHYKVVILLLADGRINIKVKINTLSVITKELSLQPPVPGVGETRYLAYLNLLDIHWKKLDPVLNIDRIIYLASLSLLGLIKHGDNSEYDRKIILSKFFWWFRLNKLYGIITSEAKDPFIKSLLLGQS